MKCSDVDKLLLPYLLSELDAEQAQNVRKHLDGCSSCTGNLQQMRRNMANLAIALPQQALDPQVKKQVLRSAESTKPPSETLTEGHPPGRNKVRSLGSALAGATVAAAIVFATLFPKVHQQQQRIGQLHAALASNAHQLSNLKRTVGARTHDLQNQRASAAAVWRSLKALDSPHVMILAMHSASKRSHAWGCILAEPSKHHWHLLISSLRPTPPRRIYQLWYITAAGKKVPGRTFHVTRQGRASVQTSVPLNIKKISGCAITSEPQGGSTQPTGAITLRASIR